MNFFKYYVSCIIDYGTWRINKIFTRSDSRSMGTIVHSLYPEQPPTDIVTDSNNRQIISCDSLAKFSCTVLTLSLP